MVTTTTASSSDNARVISPRRREGFARRDADQRLCDRRERQTELGEDLLEFRITAIMMNVTKPNIATAIQASS